MKHLILALIISAFTLPAVSGPKNRPRKYKGNIIQLALGWHAKEMCSCLFVVGQDEEYCKQYVSLKQVPNPIWTLDKEKKTVKVKFIKEREAWHVSERKGCVLL